MAKSSLSKAKRKRLSPFLAIANAENALMFLTTNKVGIFPVVIRGKSGEWGRPSPQSMILQALPCSSPGAGRTFSKARKPLIYWGFRYT